MKPPMMSSFFRAPSDARAIDPPKASIEAAASHAI